MSSLFSSFKGTAQSLTAIRRPWRDFFDITAVDIPTSSSDATTRIAQNLTHFRLNYTIILLVILCFSLIYHPLALVTFFVILLAWFFLYLARDRDEPVVIFGFLIDDRLVLAALVGLTLAGLLLTGVWGNVLAAVAVGVGSVILHAVLRSTDDLVMDDLESPYGHVLAGGDDELDSPRGDYTESWNAVSVTIPSFRVVQMNHVSNLRGCPQSMEQVAHGISPILLVIAAWNSILLRIAKGEP
ncbi:hypothetical protein V6N13_070068 [Hibiscus sabdariffa]